MGGKKQLEGGVFALNPTKLNSPAANHGREGQKAVQRTVFQHTVAKVGMRLAC